MSRKKIKHFEWVPSENNPSDTYLTGSINGEDYFNIGYYSKVKGLVIYATRRNKNLNVIALQEALEELKNSGRF